MSLEDRKGRNEKTGIASYAVTWESVNMFKEEGT